MTEEHGVDLGVAQRWADRLEKLGFRIQEHVFQMLSASESGLAVPVAEEGGDTVFALDRRVEPLVEQEVASWPDECLPFLLVAEGMGPDGRKRFGDVTQPCKYRVLLDPIDGTRGLMYDKRSGWFLAAAALDHGEATELRHTFASVIVELPTSKQQWCDSYSAISGGPTVGKRTAIGGCPADDRPPAPSQSLTLAGGFGHVVSFFQTTKRLAADLLETIAQAAVVPGKSSQHAILDDQYISTGGQMVELLNGHDRFCCDLRPLFHEVLRRQGSVCFPELVCHPYDVAGLLTAQNAGVIITDGFGRELSAPFNVNEPVHWIGYANRSLQAVIEPVIQAWLRKHGLMANPSANVIRAC